VLLLHPTISEGTPEAKLLIFNNLTVPHWTAQAQFLVNDLSRVSNILWWNYKQVLDRAIDNTHTQITRIIKNFKNPLDRVKSTQSDSERLDFNNKVTRTVFMKQINDAYRQFGLEISASIGHRPWSSGHPWEIALGLVQHTGSRTRNSVLEAMREYTKLFLQGLQRLYSSDLLEELFESTNRRHWHLPKIKSGGIRRVLRPALQNIDTQEKAFLENLFRGLDDLRTKHANRIFDIGQGMVYKHSLQNVADEFQSGRINYRQAQLSVQSHLIAMARREAGWFFDNLRDAKFMVSVPPKSEMYFTPSSAERAYLVAPAKQDTGFLGHFPGDRVFEFPVTPEMKQAGIGYWESKRKEYLARFESWKKAHK